MKKTLIYILFLTVLVTGIGISSTAVAECGVSSDSNDIEIEELNWPDVEALLADAEAAARAGDEARKIELLDQARQKAVAHCRQAMAGSPCSALPNDVAKALQAGQRVRLLGAERSECPVLAWAKRAVGPECNKDILKRNPCTATEDDVVKFLKFMQQARLLGAEWSNEQIFGWVKKAFRAIASDVTTMTDKRGFLELAQQARLFGFEQMARQLRARKPINSSCVLRWKVSIDAKYTNKMEGLKGGWNLRADFPKVKLTGWRSVLGGVSSFKTPQTTARVISNTTAYFDGGDWISCQPGGALTWQCNVMPTIVGDELCIKSGEVPLKLTMHQFDNTSKCDDGVSSPLNGIYLISDEPWIIPSEKVGEGKPFTVTRKREDEDGKAVLKFTFTPIK